MLTVRCTVALYGVVARRVVARLYLTVRRPIGLNISPYIYIKWEIKTKNVLILDVGICGMQQPVPGHLRQCALDG